MIYLDNAATSYPKPQGLLPRLEEYLIRQGGNPGRSGHRLSLAASEAVWQTREMLSKLIGAGSPENIIFAQNATHALNTAIRARVSCGDHILISDLEHNSVFRPVWRLAEDKQITYSIFSHNGDVCKSIEQLITPRTRMLICTHISNVTGFEMPVTDIIRLCRQKGVYTIIDASQSIGHQRIDVTALDCDALCAPGHKGLLGLQGSGFLYVKDGGMLRDVFQGGSGADSLSPSMPEYLPDRFEAGTLSTPAIVSMEVGIRTIEERGIDAIHHHERKLSSQLHHHLENISNITVHSIPNGGIVAFQISGISSDEVSERLNENGICVRGGYHCAPLAHKAYNTLDSGMVRVSIGLYNSPGEIELAAYHIRQIAKKARQ